MFCAYDPGMRNRTPGRYGVADMWYRPDGSLTNLAEPGTSVKKPAGQGSRWRAWYIDTGGRERTKRFAGKKMAERWASANVKEITQGVWVAPELAAETFKDVSEEWFATKAHREKMTQYGYRSLLDLVVLPKWGDVALRDIQHADLQKWINELSTTGEYRTKGEGGFSASRTIQTHQVISGVLKYAVRTDRLAKNPAEGIVLPTKKKSVRQHYLTHWQLRALAAEMGHLEGMTLLLGYCGLRVSEAFALRGRDFRGQAVEVYEAVTKVPKLGKVEKGTKTHRSRHIPVPSVAWKKISIPADSMALVFPGRKEHMTHGEYRWAFDRALRTIQERVEAIRAEEVETSGKAVTPAVPRITPHDLRHTCASLAISAGANVKAVQNLLGHATAVMTLDLYGHLMSDDLDRVRDALDEAAKSSCVPSAYGRVSGMSDIA